MPDFLVFSAMLPKLFRRKIILDIHDSMPETYAAKFKQRMGGILFRILCWEEILCSKFADKIICVNHVQKEAIMSRGVEAKKIKVLLNVPDPQKFSIGSKTHSAEKSRKSFNLVYHGTLTRRLGIDLAIMAVARLISSIPELEFHILGNGDDMDEFIELSRSLGVSRSIHFNKKMIPVEQLAEELRGMHLGLISNRKNIATELMLPVKMLEYVALDIPVAVPELKGIKHYFSPEMVRYFIPENVDSMAMAIEDLYRDQNNRAEQASKAKAFLDRFGWERHKMDLINLYRNL
jgi:glycosyltransferase involved in cell wall biosynthesis